MQIVLLFSILFPRPIFFDELSIKKTINKFDYQQLNEKNIITDGMIPKIDNCFHALENGVNDIYIGDHDIINSTKNCTKIIL